MLDMARESIGTVNELRENELNGQPSVCIHLLPVRIACMTIWI